MCSRIFESPFCFLSNGQDFVVSNAFIFILKCVSSLLNYCFFFMKTAVDFLVILYKEKDFKLFSYLYLAVLVNSSVDFQEKMLTQL